MSSEWCRAAQCSRGDGTTGRRPWERRTSLIARKSGYQGVLAAWAVAVPRPAARMRVARTTTRRRFMPFLIGRPRGGISQRSVKPPGPAGPGRVDSAVADRDPGAERRELPHHLGVAVGDPDASVRGGDAGDVRVLVEREPAGEVVGVGEPDLEERRPRHDLFAVDVEDPVGREVARSGRGDVDGSLDVAELADQEQHLLGLVHLHVLLLVAPGDGDLGVLERLVGGRAGDAVAGQADPALEGHDRLEGTVAVVTGR